MLSKKLIILIVAIVVSAAGYRLISGAGRMESKKAPAETEERNLAPDIELKGINGTTSRLSDYRSKAVLLNFWATWCPPCRYEKPLMQEIYDDYAAEGFVILAVSVGERQETVEKYIANHDYSYPVFLDPDGRAFSRYDRTGGIPQSFLIDKEGRIHTAISGARQWTAPENRQLIEEILKP